MIAKIPGKVIFSSLLFINFLQPSKSADLREINGSQLLVPKINRSKSPDSKIPTDSQNSPFKKKFEKFSADKNLLNQYTEPLLSEFIEIKKKIEIQSDKQSEINNVIFAEGKVIVSYQGKFLKADNLIYDKKNKKIVAKGNIELKFGDQFFKASHFEYSFISEKGYLLDVKGSISTGTLLNDLSSNFSKSDSNKLGTLLEFKKKEVLNTPSKVENWLFFSDKVDINGKKWKSKKAVFSNDLLELKQVKLAINSLEVISEEEKLKFKSSLSYLIFDEKVSIPFWLGNRTISKPRDGINLENKWTLGYENLDKDGYFIGRKFKSINMSDDFVINLEPQFLIQRSLKGYTKSFVKKDESITSEKVKRDTSFEDYFALKSQVKGRINNWDLQIDKNLNSFDMDKFSDAFRFKVQFIKEINFLDSKWDKSFYGIYRERVWNGSLGEAEVYSGYGSKLQKENTWVDNGIKKTEIISLGLANLRAEALNSKDLVNHTKKNFFYSIEQKFPINIKDPKNKSIDISYRYIPEPISRGLSINTKFQALYSLYGNGDHQGHLGFGLGPEFILGNFKNKTFDYTRLSIFPFYKFDSGESAFKFDQNYENFTLNIGFDQQLFGPIILKSVGTLNLTSDSVNYGEFIDSKISLNWKKRSYEFGIFYQPHNQAGGISFRLFGFK